jgi:anaerobic glycerol-3-phosphate dehydrogenase
MIIIAYFLAFLGITLAIPTADIFQCKLRNNEDMNKLMFLQEEGFIDILGDRIMKNSKELSIRLKEEIMQIPEFCKNVLRKKSPKIGYIDNGDIKNYYKDYRTQESLLKKLNQLSNDYNVTIFPSIGKSWEGRDLIAYEFGQGDKVIWINEANGKI